MQLKQTVSKKKKISINIRVSQPELQSLQEKADLYTNGNISEWIRYCAVELEPKPKDLIR